MNPFDAKPTLHQYFVENYFEPVRKELKNAPIPAVLDVAKDRAPFQVKISVATLERVRSRRDR